MLVGTLGHYLRENGLCKEVIKFQARLSWALGRQYKILRVQFLRNLGWWIRAHSRQIWLLSTFEEKQEKDCIPKNRGTFVSLVVQSFNCSRCLPFLSSTTNQLHHWEYRVPTRQCSSSFSNNNHWILWAKSTKTLPIAYRASVGSPEKVSPCKVSWRCQHTLRTDQMQCLLGLCVRSNPVFGSLWRRMQRRAGRY